MTWATKNVTRKISEAAAPAVATSGTRTRITTTSPVTASTARRGIPWFASMLPRTGERVRSFAMAYATREAAKRLACSAESMASTPATATSQ